MLNISKKVTLTGESIIDGVRVSGFRAEIDSVNPNDISLTSWQIDKAAYKTHRVAVRADEVEFEEYAYSVQDAMLAELTIAE